MATRVTLSDIRGAIDSEAQRVYDVEFTLRHAWQDSPIGSRLHRELALILQPKDNRGIRAAFRAALRHPTFSDADVKLFMGRSPQYSWALQTWKRDEDGEGITRKHEVVLGKYSRNTYVLLHELAHVACSHAMTDAAVVRGDNEGHGATWRAMICHLLAWNGFPEVAALLHTRLNEAGLPTSNAWELTTIVLRNVDTIQDALPVIPLRPQAARHWTEGGMAPWGDTSAPTWAWGDPPRCAVCGTAHHVCDCAALEARERVKCKRAIRLWLMETRGLTSAQACDMI